MVSFKRNTKLYIVQFTNGVAVSRHRLDVYGDISASQTLNETSNKQRTLHQRGNLVPSGIVLDANPADFSFTTSIMDQVSYPFLFNLACDLNTSYNLNYFDVYLETTNEIYKLEKSVITNMVFNISNVLTVTISGSSSKLSKVGSMPLALIDLVYNPTILYGIRAVIGSTEVTRVASINIEFNNDVTWTNFSTIHNSGSINYPTNYVLEEKRVSGSITQHITSENMNDLDISGAEDSLVIDIISESGQDPSLLKFSLPSIVYTRRIDFGGDVIARVYDFRLNSNLSNVKPIYKGV